MSRDRCHGDVQSARLPIHTQHLQNPIRPGFLSPCLHAWKFSKTQSENMPTMDSPM